MRTRTPRAAASCSANSSVERGTRYGELSSTDVPGHVLDVLDASAVEEITMVGRRGPAQARFTTKELRELGELANADVLLDPADLELSEADLAEVEGDRTLRANLEVLRGWAGREPEGRPRTLRLRFWLRPSEYYPVGYKITRSLIEEARNHLLLDGLIEVGCPVRILQGVQDPDVPWSHAVELSSRLANDDVVLTLVKDGDHRLSRPEDLARSVMPEQTDYMPTIQAQSGQRAFGLSTSHPASLPAPSAAPAPPSPSVGSTSIAGISIGTCNARSASATSSGVVEPLATF